MSSANMHVTMVGVGNIGAAMVRTWLKRGTSVTMWNRNPNWPVLKELVEKGAVYEPNLGKAIAAGDVVVLCVSTYDSIKEIFSPLFPLGATAAPKRIVNVSTGTSQQARDMATLLKSNGVSVYLDGAIMVTPDLIGTEFSTLYLSGENKAAFEGLSTALSPLGALIYVAEDAGAASLWDIDALAAMSSI